MTNHFSYFSYFETQCRRKMDCACNSACNSACNNKTFIGLFPPNKNCKYTGPLPLIDSRVFAFDESDEVLESQFYDFVLALIHENFGLKDFLFLLKDFPLLLRASDIIIWLRSLYYKSAILENNVCVAMIGSTIDAFFEKKVFLRDITDPQAALDTFIFLKDNEIIYTILGTKRKTLSICITFSDNRELYVLETGLFGTVICGEHLEPCEKKIMSENYTKFIQNRDETGCDYFKLGLKDVSSALRGIFEELSFIPPKNFIPFIVGTDVYPGRDKRYWTFGEQNEFGYMRPSESTMIAFVGNCTKPEMKEPVDIYECSKGKVVELQYALKEFRVNGDLDCAFESHPKMLERVAKMVPALFQAININ